LRCRISMLDSDHRVQQDLYTGWCCGYTTEQPEN
jgi:hypothetical protein